MAEHGQMLEALEARDAAGMRALMTTHLRRKRDAVLELIHKAQLP